MRRRGAMPFESQEELWDRASRYLGTFFLDEQVSLKNKALLWAIEMHKTLTIEEIHNICSDGRSSITSGLKELEELGFIKKVRERDSNGKYKPTTYEICYPESS